MRCRGKLLKAEGFTLVEILVALAVLLVTAVAFVPLFVFLAQGSQANRARLVAAELAAGVIEEIRSLPYDAIGTDGGNPPGVVEHLVTVSAGGSTYTVRTDIWWVDDPADNDAGGGDPIPYDYKRVRVTVTAPGLFTGEVTVTEDINTLAALEGEEEAFPGGNLLSLVQRGWRVTTDDPVPVENVEVELTAGPDAPQTLWTDESGKALFAVLDAGTYTVAADAGGQGMMVRPDQNEQTVEVTEGQTSTVVFQVEYPCFLNIRLIDEKTGSSINSGGRIYLETPFGTVEKVFSAGAGGILPPDFIGGLWPVGDGYAGAPYNLQIRATGYVPFDLSQHRDIWDGTFSSPGETKDLTIGLTPATAAVTVTSAGSGSPVSGARVEIYLHTYTYQSGGWTESCTPVDTALTGGDGVAAFALPDNDPYAPPPVPQEGSRYSRYCVRVTSAGYLPFGPAHSAFWVTDGRQMTEYGPVDTYPVNLQPDFRRIRVQAQRSNGTPRNNVLIRVQGPGGYDVQKQTGAEGVPGEALFDNLSPGTYQVTRRQGNRWVDPRQVEAVWGEYLVTYIY